MIKLSKGTGFPIEYSKGDEIMKVIKRIGTMLSEYYKSFSVDYHA